MFLKTARLGTLSDKAGTGLTMMAGNFDSPYDVNKTRAGKKLRWWLNDQLQVNLGGYDATLQRGIFNRSSPYTIAADHLTRVSLQNRYGIVIHYKKLYLEYFQSILTKEFKTGSTHRSGGINAGFTR